MTTTQGLTGARAGLCDRDARGTWERAVGHLRRSVTQWFHGDATRFRDGPRTCREDVEDGHVVAEAEGEGEEVTGSWSRWVGARWARAVLWIAAVVAGVLVAASPALAGGVAVRYPPTPGGGGLNGVQCFGGIRSCLAVGGSSKGVLVDRLTGSAWSQVRAPDPHVRGTATLISISCAGAGSCVAVGGNGCGGPLAEVWNGHVWSVADAGLPACRPYLYSVSCASGTACMAVGGACSATYFGNGPNLGGLNSVIDCTTFRGGVVERWDGRSWSAIKYKAPYPVSPIGVSCPVRDGCAVVGVDSSGESVVGWWNGSRLSFLGLGDGSFASSRGGEAAAAMSGVSCTSVHFCEAVGATQTNTFNPSAAEAITWNGRRWGPPTGPPAQDGDLNAVSCVAAGDCVAIDGGGMGTGGYFERLSAGSWESDAQDPGVPQISNNDAPWDSANAVWCGSLASCVTVGVHLEGSDVVVGPMAAAGDL